jgi:hypothetical protein
MAPRIRIKKGENKMIDISKILKRAWHILWNYRILWVFGFLLAVTAGGGGGGSNSGARFSGNNGDAPRWENPPEFVSEAGEWFTQNVEPLFATEQRAIETAIWMGVGILIFALVVGVLTALVRYPTETAVIRMVDDYEKTGNKVGFRQGWKMGWNRSAFRLWLIDLLLGLPVFLFVAILIAVGLGVYFSVENTSGPSVPGMVALIGLGLLFFTAFILGMILLGLLSNFFKRVAVLEGSGVFESIRRGWQMFKANWKSAAVMWLVMLGVGIGSAIAGIILFLLLIPVLIITIVAGVLVAAIPGLLVYLLFNLFSPQWVAILAGVLAGLPLFGIIGFAPISVLSGWVRIFESSIWTLTYREFKALENIKPAKEIAAKAS